MFKKMFITLSLIACLSFSACVFGSFAQTIMPYIHTTNTINELDQFENEFASLKFSNLPIVAGTMTNSSKLLSDDTRDDLFLINSYNYGYEDNKSDVYDIHNYTTVSKNYFNYFDVYDENGNKIVINPSENRGILLVPKQYKDMEDEIYDYFTTVRKDFTKIEDTSVFVNENASEDVVIYYIKDDQYIQTFNTTSTSTKIKDPIINVLSDENIIISGMSVLNNEGIYVSLDGMTLEEKYATLSDDLEKYDLTEKYPELVRLDSGVSLKKAIYHEAIIVNLILSIITFAISILLIYLFNTKVFNYNTSYAVVTIIILCFSIYISKYIARIYNYALFRTSIPIYILIFIVYLIMFLLINKKVKK